MTTLAKLSFLFTLASSTSLAQSQLFDWSYTAGPDSAAGIFDTSFVSTLQGVSYYNVTGISGVWDSIPISGLNAAGIIEVPVTSASLEQEAYFLGFTAGANDVVYSASNSTETIDDGPSYSATNPLVITEAPWNPSDGIVVLGSAIFCVRGYLGRRRSFRLQGTDV